MAESPQYRSWDERFDGFLNDFVAPIVAPLATALPMALPMVARAAEMGIGGAAQAVTLPYRVQQAYGGDWYSAARDPGMAAEGLNAAGMLSRGNAGGLPARRARERAGHASALCFAANG